MSSLEKYQAPIAELDLWAKRLYESGMFKDVKDVAEAFVKVTAGAELGLSPSQAMRGVHVIQGKTIIGAGLLSSLLDRPPYDFTTRFEPNIEAPTSCTITVFKNGVERGQSHFSLDDAKRAGLLKGGGNWEKYPSDMLFARAVSQAARRYAAGALGGAVYVEAHGEFEIQPDAPATPNGVTAKPRTRVTAEVVREPVAGEVIDYEPVTYDLKASLKAMNQEDRRSLYRFVGITQTAKLAEVHALLVEAHSDLDLGDTDEPDPRSVLTGYRKRAVAGASAEAFQAFADTGEDISEGDQVSMYGVEAPA